MAAGYVDYRSTHYARHIVEIENSGPLLGLGTHCSVNKADRTRCTVRRTAAGQNTRCIALEPGSCIHCA